jgi:hypothetical protein
MNMNKINKKNNKIWNTAEFCQIPWQGIPRNSEKFREISYTYITYRRKKNIRNDDLAELCKQ